MAIAAASYWIGTLGIEKPAFLSGAAAGRLRFQPETTTAALRG